MADDIKTPADIAEEAKQAGRDATTAASGLVKDAQAIGSNTVQALRPAMEDAKATAREAADTAKGLASDAKDIAGDALHTARDYARSATAVASEKLGELKAKASDAQVVAARYIADEPVKSVLIGMAAGALFAALVMHLGRGPDRRWER